MSTNSNPAAQPQKVFISFADTRMAAASARIVKQAQKFDFFDVIRAYDETKLDKDFVQKFAHALRPGVRGFGYWCWKSHIILKEMEQLAEGSILVYLDAGCHFNIQGKPRFLEYMEMLRLCPLGILAFPVFCKSADAAERRWTKGDVFEYFRCRNRDDILNSPQLAGGHILCRKCEASMQLLRAWTRAYDDDFSLVEDTPSRTPNHPDFIENRHDQSVFSVLFKLSGGTPLPDGETESEDWSRMWQYPFLDFRDKGYAARNLKRWKKYRFLASITFGALRRKYEKKCNDILQQHPYIFP